MTHSADITRIPRIGRGLAWRNRPSSRQILIIGVVAAALLAGAVTIAQTAGGDSDPDLTGPQQARIEHAALAVVNGTRVLSIERVAEGPVAWKVHVFKRTEPLDTWAGKRTDGVRIMVRLDRHLHWVSAGVAGYGMDDGLDPR